MNLLDNVIFFLFLSFVVGISVDPVLRQTKYYGFLSSRYLFSRPETYERLGVLWYRRMLKVTPLGSFNRDIHLRRQCDPDSLKIVRSHMAKAEVSHWVGFVAMSGMTCVAWWFRGATIGLIYVVFNVLGNLYPCMVQQYNKRRLRRLIASLETRSKSP